MSSAQLIVAQLLPPSPARKVQFTEPVGVGQTEFQCNCNAILSAGRQQVLAMPLLDAAAGIRKRFAEAQETRPHAEHNLEAGQEFVAACVDYGHCVEGLHQAAQGRDAYRAKGQQAGSTMDAHHERIPRHNH